jgi:hypothetical protein
MPLEPTRFSVFATLGAVLVAWHCGITLYRGPNLPSPIALIYAAAATYRMWSDGTEFRWTREMAPTI